jgi:hypothetical protein
VGFVAANHTDKAPTISNFCEGFAKENAIGDPSGVSGIKLSTEREGFKPSPTPEKWCTVYYIWDSICFY